jgi:hypothetical protein
MPACLRCSFSAKPPRLLAGLGHRCYKRAMKVPHFLAVGAAAAAAVLTPAGSAAEAPQRALMGGGPRSLPRDHHGGIHGNHRFYLPFFVVERAPTVIIEREVVREVPVVVEPPPPPPPSRKPYEIGTTYDSLPGGCMKLIERGASHFLCSGEWYRQVGSGGAVKYKAVAKP